MLKQAGKPFCALVLMAALSGCGTVRNSLHDTSIDRADDVGLVGAASPQFPMPADLIVPTTTVAATMSPTARNAYVEGWMTRSDYLCRRYKDRLISLSRDGRLTTDILSGTLSGLATIFTAASTAHPLAGAATIVTGIGSAYSSDMFAQQAGDVLASAIETARENQANVIEKNLQDTDQTTYGLYRAMRDVQDYHNMCSLETAFKQIKSSLSLTAPDAGATPPASQGTQVTQTPVISSSALSGSTTSQRIRTWLWLGGHVDTAHADALNDWMTTQSVDPELKNEPYVELLGTGGGSGQPSSAILESDRLQAIKDLNIP